MRKSILPRRHWARAPDTEEATIWLAPVATAIDGGNARKHQKRGEQKAAAHPEHARQEADRRAKPQHDQKVHRELGNGEVDLKHRIQEARGPKLDWYYLTNMRAVMAALVPPRRKMPGTRPGMTNSGRGAELAGEALELGHEGDGDLAGLL